MKLGVHENSAALSATFTEFRRWNKREMDVLVKDQSRRLANDLYNVTAEIAPSESQIAADVRALGWHIPKYFHTGGNRGWRLGRGFPEQWMEAAWKRLAGKNRGRPSKEMKAEEAAFKERKPTLSQMQAFVIKLRTDASLYLASGFLGAIADLGGFLKGRRGKSTSGVNPIRGRADIIRGSLHVAVDIINDSPGIVQQNAKHELARKAIAARIRGMHEYIAARRIKMAALMSRKAGLG